MPKKKETKEPAPEAPEEKAPEEKPEEPDDPPIVKELKEIDDKYLELEVQYEKEVQELQRKYTEKQAPLLDQRKQVLTKADDAETPTGTPALKGFWLKAMQNLPALEDQIEEWDIDVLEYCSDVTKGYLDSTDLSKGFKLTFHFVENPYFTNDTLWKEYHTEEGSPYTGEIDTKEIKVNDTDWKPGKDVTVEKIAKKAKGGGAKKNKQKTKEKEEPRDSFFRSIFRNLRPDMPMPADVNLEEARAMGMGGDDSDDDDQAMMGLLMENDYEIGCSIRDQLIPFAVRWYTGEARQEDGFGDDSDEDDDEDSEDEDDDDDDDDESEDEPAPKKKAQPKAKGRGGGGKAGPNPEECKQQ